MPISKGQASVGKGKLALESDAVLAYIDDLVSWKSDFKQGGISLRSVNMNCIREANHDLNTTGIQKKLTSEHCHKDKCMECIEIIYSNS